MSTTQYADVARDLRRARDRAATLLAEIRAAAKYLKTEHGYSLGCLADKKITNLHRNTVMKLNSDPNWIPNAETLGHLAELIVEAELKRAGKPGRVTPAPRGRPAANLAAADSRQAAIKTTRATSLKGDKPRPRDAAPQRKPTRKTTRKTSSRSKAN